MTREQIIQDEVDIWYEQTGSLTADTIIRRAFSLGEQFEREKAQDLLRRFGVCIPIDAYNNVYLGEFDKIVKEVQEYIK